MIYTHFTIYASFNGPFPQAEVSRLIQQYFAGASINFSKGLFEGQWEHSFQIHLLVPNPSALDQERAAIELAELLCVELDQSEVWIEQYQTTVTKVTA